MPEMMMIFVIILILFGAKKLPELARGVGKAMGEFKKARDDFEREITYAVNHAENEVKTTQPVVHEPVIKEPSIKEPSIKEPVIQEPAGHEPKASSPQ